MASNKWTKMSQSDKDQLQAKLETFSQEVAARTQTANEADADCRRERTPKHTEKAQAAGKAIGSAFDSLWQALETLGYINPEDSSVYDGLGELIASQAERETGRNIKLYLH